MCWTIHRQTICEFSSYESDGANRISNFWVEKCSHLSWNDICAVSIWNLHSLSVHACIFLWCTPNVYYLLRILFACHNPWANVFGFSSMNNSSNTNPLKNSNYHKIVYNDKIIAFRNLENSIRRNWAILIRVSISLHIKTVFKQKSTCIIVAFSLYISWPQFSCSR